MKFYKIMVKKPVSNKNYKKYLHFFLEAHFDCSVCINLLQQSVRGEMHCECAHSGPFVQQEFRARNALDYGALPTCVMVATRKLPTDESNLAQGEADFRVCYESGCGN